MAEMVPDSLPAGRSQGERRLFDILCRLPDDCVVYYEPEGDSTQPTFVVICPHLGLLAIKCVGWRAEQLAAIRETCLELTGTPPRRQINPVVEARAYLETIAGRCQSQPGFEVLLARGGQSAPHNFVFPTGYAAFLPNVNENELSSHALGDLTEAFPPSQTITRDVFMPWWENANFALHQVEAALRCYMGRCRMAIPLSAGQIRTLRAVVHPEIRLAESPELIVGGVEAEPALNIDIAVLDLRQERHARSLGSGHRLIHGVAGSGKTVLLIARARYLASEHPNQRILFLCFNVTLASYLRRKLADPKNVEVYHFDQWSRQNRVTRGRSESDDDLGESLLASLQRRGDDARVYDTVLIDEAQDFSPSWFRCVLATMKDPLDGDLVIVSDASQGLYRRTGISWRSLGIRASGRTVHLGFDLDRNYRNTREIVELARQFASPPTEDDEEGVFCLPVDPAKARRSIGMKPILFKERFRSAECNRVVKLVRGLLEGKWMDNVLPKPLLDREIGILYPMIPAQSRNEFNGFVDHLRELAPVRWLVQNRGEDGRTMVNEPGIKVQTIHSAKGLEYRAVIIMWADLLPRLFFEDHDEAEERRLMYVALTRAVDFLAITYSRPSDFINEIRQSGSVLLS
jgi:hypothetical protein